MTWIESSCSAEATACARSPCYCGPCLWRPYFLWAFGDDGRTGHALRAGGHAGVQGRGLRSPALAPPTGPARRDHRSNLSQPPFVASRVCPGAELPRLLRPTTAHELQPRRNDAGTDMRDHYRQGGRSGKDARERGQPPRPHKPPAQKSETTVQQQRPQPPFEAPPREQQAPKSQGKGGGGRQGQGATRDPGREPKPGWDKEPEKAHDNAHDNAEE